MIASNRPVPRQSSTMRILNGVVLVLIGLSALAQFLRYILMYIEPGNNGLTPGGFLGLISFTVIPGMLLAFAKLIVNLLRIFKSPKARLNLVIYLFVLFLPVTLPMILAVSPNRSKEIVIAESQIEREESEQFIAGHEWGEANKPLHTSACNGSHEFNRGCRKQIEERRNEEGEAGKNWAQKNRPEKVVQCRGQGTPYFVMGCRGYFDMYLRKPKSAELGRYEGMTTAECIEEVNAKWEALRDIDLENENFRSILAHRNRNWEPELSDCQNYDITAEAKAHALSQALKSK